MIRKALVLIAMMVAFASWKVKAEIPKHQINGSTNAYVLLNDVGDDEVDVSIHFDFGHAYAFNEFLQVYVGSSINFGDIVDTYSLMTGPVFNIPVTKKNKLQNAFFIIPKIGFGLIAYEYTFWNGDTVDKETTEGLWGIEIGKRFALMDHVSLATSIATTKWMDPLPKNKDDFDIYWNLFYINVHF